MSLEDRLRRLEALGDPERRGPVHIRVRTEPGDDDGDAFVFTLRFDRADTEEAHGHDGS